MSTILKFRLQSNSTLLIVSFLFIFISCRKKTVLNDSQLENHNIGQEIFSSVESSIDTKNNLKHFRTEQLGDRRFVLQPTDTVELAKPILKLFSGEIDGKNVQFWLSSRLLRQLDISFESCYEITTWTEGGNFLRHCYIKEIANNRYAGEILKFSNEAKSLNDTILYKIVFDKEDANHLSVCYKNKMLEFSESNLQFIAYDKFTFENLLCEEYDDLYPKWSYFFDFRFNNSKLSHQDNSLSKIKDLSDTYLSWQDSIKLELTLNSIYCDTPWGSFYEENYTQPLYLDSLIFVVVNIVNSREGGAHSMTCTNYTNYDLQTGSKIKLSDILELNTIAYREFYNKLIDRDSYQGLYVSNEAIDEQIAPTSFYILPNGIGLHYAAYKLKGGFLEQEKFLSYNEIKPFLKTDKYFRK